MSWEYNGLEKRYEGQKQIAHAAKTHRGLWREVNIEKNTSIFQSQWNNKRNTLICTGEWTFHKKLWIHIIIRYPHKFTRNETILLKE